MRIERNLRARFIIKCICRELQIPEKVAREANRLVRLVYEEDVAKGQPMDLVVLAAIFIACRLHGYPTLLYEVIKAYNLILTGDIESVNESMLKDGG